MLKYLFFLIFRKTTYCQHLDFILKIHKIKIPPHLIIPLI